eukprot:TRINITY_DN12179_c0_g1_i1.p1 TRINITY_DN12179_c0_g1~~TRINITY_DN12179_c0_g1_i1.p1  ORF type:complete len:123 (+),score=50.63 TRINITY_DN12179_c0_g1_i1:190-558(+)
MGGINWGGSGEAKCYPFIKDLYEDIDRLLPSYSKGVGWIENEIPEEKRAEDELYQQIKAGQDAWMTAWAETKVHSVSYTHLRAHETVLDLVCRLLLEKKKNKSQLNVDNNIHIQVKNRSYIR